MPRLRESEANIRFSVCSCGLLRDSTLVIKKTNLYTLQWKECNKEGRNETIQTYNFVLMVLALMKIYVKYFLILYFPNLCAQHRWGYTTFGKGWTESLVIEMAKPGRTELYLWWLLSQSRQVSSYTAVSPRAVRPCKKILHRNPGNCW